MLPSRCFKRLGWTTQDYFYQKWFFIKSVSIRFFYILCIILNLNLHINWKLKRISGTILYQTYRSTCQVYILFISIYFHFTYWILFKIWLDQFSNLVLYKKIYNLFMEFEKFSSAIYHEIKFDKFWMKDQLGSWDNATYYCRLADY